VKILIRVADFIASYLVELGITDVFLVSGGGMMYLLDGLECNEDINFICAHNEAAAAVMAEGYSRVNNNLGVLYVTTGPGATNAITGAVDAWVDSIPILVISGQAKRSQNVYNSGIDGLRSLGGQEVNILPIVESFTKYSAMVDDPEKIKYHLDRAVYEAKNGRPGPSWLDIPLDVQSAMVNEANLESFIPKTTPTDHIIETQLKETLKLLKESKRPVIIVGNGVRLSGAEEDFLKLIEETKIPVVASKLGQDIIDNNSPYYAGFGGTKGTRAGNLAMQNADLIVSLGSRLAIPFVGYEYELFAREAKKIAVDIDHRELEKNTIKLDIPINSDVKFFIQKLLEKLAGTTLPEYSEWIKKCQDWKARYYDVPEGLSKAQKPVSSYNLFDSFNKFLDEKSIVIADAGTVYCIISQAFKVKQGQRAITPACLGTMGLSLPMGIGAHFADKNATVLAVTGDGSLQMNIQELQTLYHYQIPLKLFVINNQGYLSIKNTQNSYFKCRYAGCSPESGVSCPDLERIAHAYKIEYKCIKQLAELENIVKSTMDFPGPVICEVFTDPEQKIIPSVSSKELDDGRLVSAPLEDMWPFLSEEKLEKNMVIKPVKFKK
jgi:acetolactate synthase I/II/III large subunit